MSHIVLGISAYYHDSAAAIVLGGDIIAAAQEERFTRRKHDAAFPKQAILFCLEQLGKNLSQIDAIVFYDKPLTKFDRLLETYLNFAPRGVRSFVSAMPVWMKEKLFLDETLRKELAQLFGVKKKQLPPLLFCDHHMSHAASAFFPSPYQRAGVLCIDGVGEWATTSVWLGDGHTLTPQWQIDFPHSLGLLYSAFTYYTGFKVNSGEYKLMGLAPYGEPRFVETIRRHLIDVKEDGTYRLNQKYFNYATGLTMTNHYFDDLFGGPPRSPESPLTQREMDIAASIQKVTEDIVLRLGHTIYNELGVDYLCMAGGVALNCVANGKLLREGPFTDIWVQPAAGDAGGALGAALSVVHHYFKEQRSIDGRDKMRGSFLGPNLVQSRVKTELDRLGAIYQVYTDELLFDYVADLLSQGHVIGWVQGPMEFGPRALGARSIIGDPRHPKMQSIMNLKIKFRESFRPFAPAVLAERVHEYFEHHKSSPYMLMVAPVHKNQRLPVQEQEQNLFGIDKLNSLRSKIPAVTHVDYSARVQTIHQETNPRFYQLISQFDKRTGCPVIVNTSFNVRGEPIVCSATDAYRCFMRTEMDYLVVENCVMAKLDQPSLKHDSNWRQEFTLD